MLPLVRLIYVYHIKPASISQQCHLSRKTHDRINFSGLICFPRFPGILLCEVRCFNDTVLPETPIFC